MIAERFFNSREQLYQELANDCAEQLQAAVKLRGGASFLVSGGSSPAEVYRQLAQCSLPWSAIEVALVDERWVTAAEAGSNEAFIAETLLQQRASVAQRVGMKTAHDSPWEAQLACEARYRCLAQPFDLTLLGMGTDGHTASLFPNAEGLDKALATENTCLCAAITAQPSEVTGEFTDRMTLSLTGLMSSRAIKVLMTGAEKLDVYRKAKAGRDVFSMPIRAVLHQQQVPVTVYWAP